MGYSAKFFFSMDLTGLHWVTEGSGEEERGV